MPKVIFEEWLEDENLLRVEGWARRGLTDKQIARNIGVTEAAYYEWERKYPDFREAVRRGRAPVEVELENTLIRKAFGFVETEPEIVEEIVEKNGVITHKKKKVQKVYPPDTGALIFLLKNKLREEYQERPKTKIEREQIKLQNEHQKLQNDLMRKMLQDSNAGLDMVKKLIEDIDGEVIEEVIEEAEEVIE